MANRCNSCGATVPDNATVCPYCGNAVTPTQSSNALYQENRADDQPSTGLNVLSLFIPLVGWILYFVYKNETPVKAGSCAKWAWIGFGISVFFEIIGLLLAD